MKKPKVWIRVDGGGTLGMGHIMRCSALAEMLSDHFECGLIIKHPEQWKNSSWARFYCEISYIPANQNHLDELKWISKQVNPEDILVLDGYHFNTEYQQACIHNGYTLVCIDDIHTFPFVSHVVINHAGGIQQNMYSVTPSTRLCLGTDWALIRPLFSQIKKERSTQVNQNCLICLGGADPENATLYCLQKALMIDNTLQYKVVTGPAFKHTEVIQNFLHETKFPVEWVHDISQETLAILMKSCDRAITSPSTVSYEYLSTGGILYVHRIAENQRDLETFLLNGHYAFSLEEEFGTIALDEEMNALKRSELLFDGKNGERYIHLFQSLVQEHNDAGIWMRKANHLDIDVLFAWANDPNTRENSYNQELIGYTDHVRWFNNLINDTSTELWIFSNAQNELIGNVRIQEKEGGNAVIGISVDIKARGRGYAAKMIQKVSSLYKIDHPEIVIEAWIKKTNTASFKVFTKAGYVLKEEKEIQGIPSWVLVY